MKALWPWLGRLVLGGIFAYAAVTKLLDPAAFATDIGHYRLLPHSATVLLANYLPWLELLCSTAVLCRRQERGALTILVILCLMFALALASAWIRDLDITCGCFGHGTTTGVPWAMVRNAILALIAVALLRCPARQA